MVKVEQIVVIDSGRTITEIKSKKKKKNLINMITKEI